MGTSAARDRMPRNLIVRIIVGVVFGGLLVSAAVAGVVAWSRRRYTPRLFLAATGIMFAVTLAAAANSWPSSRALSSPRFRCRFNSSAQSASGSSHSSTRRWRDWRSALNRPGWKTAGRFRRGRVAAGVRGRRIRRGAPGVGRIAPDAGVGCCRQHRAPRDIRARDGGGLRTARRLPDACRCDAQPAHGHSPRDARLDAATRALSGRSSSWWGFSALARRPDRSSPAGQQAEPCSASACSSPTRRSFSLISRWSRWRSA